MGDNLQKVHHNKVINREVWKEPPKVLKLDQTMVDPILKEKSLKSEYLFALKYSWNLLVILYPNVTTNDIFLYPYKYEGTVTIRANFVFEFDPSIVFIFYSTILLWVDSFFT